MNPINLFLIDLVCLNNKPILGADDTYLKHDWRFKAEDMLVKVRKTMELKKIGHEPPGNQDHDIHINGGKTR
jgi:hypothetical protein